MVQMLLTAVSDRATGTDERMVVIDEAHSLLDDAAALDFLATAVRHNRYYDRFGQFIMQTGGEFTLTPEARTIANLCSIPLIHRVREAADELAD